MKLLKNRILIAAKRSILSPIMYIMVILIVFLSVLQVTIPEKQKSAFIPVAILNHDDNEESIAVVDELCSMNSVFNFYEVKSEEEMYEQMAQGEVATGYIIPEGFFEHSATLRRSLKIKMICTPAAGALSSLATEELFSRFFRKSARLLTEEILDEEGLIRSEEERLLLYEIYEEKISGDEIFSMRGLEGTVYNDKTRSEKVDIPVYKFAGLFIYTAALMGILAFLSDYDNKIYLRFNRIEKIYMTFVQIGVYTVPMTIVSLLAFIVTRARYSALWVIGYMFLMILISIVIGTIFAWLPIRSSKSGIFAAILPVYLILCFLFSGILFDLASFSPLMKHLSLVFPPSFF